MSDPYLDPSSGVLRNKLGFTDQESLDRAESDSVVVRGTLLDLNPPKGIFVDQSQSVQRGSTFGFRS